MGLPVTFASLGAGNQPLSLFDTQFAAVAALGSIPCAAGAGPNNITLTPFSNTPAITSYADLSPSFVFVAAANSTGAVALNVSGVGLRNAYKWNGEVSIGTGDIVSGNVYKAASLAALNGGLGGFVVDAVGVGGFYTDVEFVIDGGGSPITTGVKGFLRIPFPANIFNWQVMADQSGSVTVDILRSSNFTPPTTSIVGTGNKPFLTSQQVQGQAVSGWTSTLLAQGDWLGFQVISAVTITRLTVTLQMFKQ